jgi:hypothetical protein
MMKSIPRSGLYWMLFTSNSPFDSSRAKYTRIFNIRLFKNRVAISLSLIIVLTGLNTD